MSVQQFALLVGIAAVVTLVLTPPVRRLSERWGIVARGGGRNVHKGEISRFGGVAMFAGCAVALGVQAAGEHFLGWSGGLLAGGWQTAGVMAGATTMFLVGVLDDIYTLSPGPKLVGQVVAAGLAIAAGLRVDFVGNPFGGGLIALGFFSLPVTLVWIVGFTNVINLIDGIDGLAAGITAIAAAGFLVLAFQANQFVAAMLAAALIGSCVAFLRYNFNPASIIMGDSGALFLGYVLSTIALLGVMKSVAAVTLVVPLLIIGVPIFDTASAIIRRVRHQRPISEADKGHIHHRLLGRGFNQRQTVLIIYAWSALLAVGGYAMRWSPAPIKLGSFVVLAAMSGMMSYWLGLFESAHHHAEEE